MKDFKYKIRASKSLALITSCSKKVSNKLQWEFQEGKPYSNSLVKIAVEIYNNAEFGYEPPNVITYDTDNGTKNEALGVALYDKVYGTNYLPSYMDKVDNRERRENAYCSGERDFGDDFKTIDCKNSTCKNTFDTKRFLDLEHNYISQQNVYGILWKTPELELCNFLSPKNHNEIKKMVDSYRYFNYDFDDIHYEEYQDKLEEMYCYSPFNGYKPEMMISRRPVPHIENFEETLIKCVAKMNEFIEEKLEK